ncbi:DUF2182 domain-containing protein [Hahella aquimaris]|uniref:DUF2182 domain-containing protein n=1 Tax=Hahella sp. HNIBRBA332 TaxID=3015983 RepID=UPI00273CC45C|nr:DUF2182 domain-containing protein [Hahella sp. HNIBRBA332]WLQ13263.1 DUF2182 domain-containing protein [Hahella sp. HNIBRBA332]
MSDRMSRLTTAHPYWWLFMVSALSWAYLISAELSRSVHSHHHMSATPIVALSSSLVAWLMMVSAMMLPMLSGSVRRVKIMMPRYQHLRLMPLLVFGYSIVWLIAGAVVEVIRGIFFQLPYIEHDVISPLPVGSLTFLAAAVWNNTSSRRKAVFACSSGVPMRISGWYAYRDAVYFGLIKGISCVKACLHVMLALVITGHNLWLMMIVTAVLLYERILLPRETRLVSWMCCALAVYQLLIWLN